MKKNISIILSVCIVICFAGCDRAYKHTTEYISRNSFMLDTLIEIRLYDWEEEYTLTLAMEEISRLERMLSATYEGSDIYCLNQEDGKSWVTISKECEEVLALAKEYWTKSDGNFDITIGPLINLWNIRNGGHYPSEKELSETLAKISTDRLLIKERKAFLSEPGMEVELGAIAKGYIADQVKIILLKEGVKHGIIDLGRNILAFGGKSDNEPFIIGVQDPFKPGEVIAELAIENNSVVTAGAYERYFIHEGVRYHHILNPFTGFPADTGLESVTVISDYSADGDSLSTICMLLGEKKGLSLIESLSGVEALFVRSDGICVESSGFSDYVVKRYYTLAE
ncbi:MAG: thiamine biosynthesis lipoprotein ApbE [Neobacillus sp.]|nr:thiamine biosynthesis lipoprotein ApbE [Neobacillus sp.]